MRDFNHTVRVLVKAYLNGHLRHSDCAACAVGNIIADSIGANIEMDEVFGGEWIRNNAYLTIGWSDVFCTRNGLQDVNQKNYIGQIKRQIDASGYTWKELAAIEYAFETCEMPLECNWEDFTNDQWMFNGLMAVVDVLAEIHGVDLTTKESAKLLFVK